MQNAAEGLGDEDENHVEDGDEDEDVYLNRF